MTDATPASQPLALEATNVSKAFGGIPALAGVDIEVGYGEVHALLGENGSGKSTFIKILSGYHQPDSGSATVHGRPLEFGDPVSSYGAGCRFVHQDLGLVEGRSVLDNLFLNTGFPTRFGTIRHRVAARIARTALDRVGLSLDLDTLVGELSPAVRSGVALARVLREDPTSPTRLFILDEPTATLPDPEVRQLLDIIRRVAAGGVGVLLVTHRLEEVFQVADRVTVLRDGRRVATRPMAELDRRQLINLLVGAEFTEVAEQSERIAGNIAASSPVLEVERVTALGLDNVSFTVPRGEILGIAGIVGSGRETILGSIFGAHPRTGSVIVDGTAIPSARPDLANRAGLAFLPADRKRLGGFMNLTVRENITLTDLSPFWRRLTLSRRQERREVRQWLESLKVRPSDVTERPLATYSGGNQQRILFAKWLRRRPPVFLLDEPTQGVDVAAKAALHKELIDAAAKGAGIVVSSSDVDELAALCHKVVVMHASKIVAHLDGPDVTVQQILLASMASTEGHADD